MVDHERLHPSVQEKEMVNDPLLPEMMKRHDIQIGEASRNHKIFFIGDKKRWFLLDLKNRSDFFRLLIG